MYIDHIRNLVRQPVHSAECRDIVLKWLLKDKAKSGSFSLKNVSVDPGQKADVGCRGSYCELYITRGSGMLKWKNGKTLVVPGTVLYAYQNELAKLENTGREQLEAICYS